MAKNTRSTEVEYSFLFHRLYGKKSYSELKDYHNVLVAKKYYLKLIKSITHSIKETITITDYNQIKSLDVILKIGEKQLKTCKTFSELDQIFISIETKLIFQLIGQIPNNNSKSNVINRKEVWGLNNYRQIQYVQSAKNKEMMIFKIVQENHIETFGNLDNFFLMYYEKCNNNPDCLIEYLKLNHPEIYAEI